MGWIMLSIDKFKELELGILTILEDRVKSGIVTKPKIRQKVELTLNDNNGVDLFVPEMFINGDEDIFNSFLSSIDMKVISVRKAGGKYIFDIRSVNNA